MPELPPQLRGIPPAVRRGLGEAVDTSRRTLGRASHTIATRSRESLRRTRRLTDRVNTWGAREQAAQLAAVRRRLIAIRSGGNSLGTGLKRTFENLGTEGEVSQGPFEVQTYDDILPDPTISPRLPLPWEGLPDAEVPHELIDGLKSIEERVLLMKEVDLLRSEGTDFTGVELGEMSNEEIDALLNEKKPDRRPVLEEAPAVEIIPAEPKTVGETATTPAIESEESLPNEAIRSEDGRTAAPAETFSIDFKDIIPELEAAGVDVKDKNLLDQIHETWDAINRGAVALKKEEERRNYSAFLSQVTKLEEKARFDKIWESDIGKALIAASVGKGAVTIVALLPQLRVASKVAQALVAAQELTSITSPQAKNIDHLTGLTYEVIFLGTTDSALSVRAILGSIAGEITPEKFVELYHNATHLLEPTFDAFSEKIGLRKSRNVPPTPSSPTPILPEPKIGEGLSEGSTDIPEAIHMQDLYRRYGEVKQRLENTKKKQQVEIEKLVEKQKGKGDNTDTFVISSDDLSSVISDEISQLNSELVEIDRTISTFEDQVLPEILGVEKTLIDQAQSELHTRYNDNLRPAVINYYAGLPGAREVLDRELAGFNQLTGKSITVEEFLRLHDSLVNEAPIGDSKPVSSTKSVGSPQTSVTGVSEATVPPRVQPNIEELETLSEDMSLDLLYQKNFAAQALKDELERQVQKVVDEKFKGDWSKISEQSTELDQDERDLYKEYNRAKKAYFNLSDSLYAAESNIIRTLLQVSDQVIREGDTWLAIRDVGSSMRELNKVKRECTNLDPARERLRTSLENVNRRTRNAYLNYQPFSSEEAAKRLEELPTNTIQVKNIEGMIAPLRQSINLEPRANIYRDIDNAYIWQDNALVRNKGQLTRDFSVLLNDIRSDLELEGKSFPALENPAITFEDGKMIFTTQVREMVGLIKKSEVVIPLRIVVVNSDQPPGIAIEPINLSHLEGRLRLVIQTTKRKELDAIRTFPTQLVDILNAKLFEKKVTGFRISTTNDNTDPYYFEIRGMNKET